MATLDLNHAFVDELEPPKWIIEGVVPASTVVLVAGDAGTGKTVLHLAEAMHVALGLPFLGYKTYQARVLYFDQENSRPDLLAYIYRLWHGMGKPDARILKDMLRVESMSLGDEQWAARALRISQEWKPGLTYIDTATSALAIENENDNSEAHKAGNKIKRIIEEGSQSAFRLLKHAKYISGGGHGGGTRRTIRGAKAWLGAVDQVVYHIRAEGGRPRNDGLHATILLPDKRRAYGLSRHIRITPSYGDAEGKSLILKGETFTPEKDLMIVEG